MSLIQSSTQRQKNGQAENPCRLDLVRLVAFSRTVTGTSFGSGRMSQAKKRGSEYERESALLRVPAKSQHPNGNKRLGKSSRPAERILPSISKRSFVRTTALRFVNRPRFGWSPFPLHLWFLSRKLCPSLCVGSRVHSISGDSGKTNRTSCEKPRITTLGCPGPRYSFCLGSFGLPSEPPMEQNQFCGVSSDLGSSGDGAPSCAFERHAGRDMLILAFVP